MNPCALTTALTALANSLACRMTTDELTLLGVILTQLGDTLTTIAVQKELLCRAQPEKSLSGDHQCVQSPL